MPTQLTLRPEAIRIRTNCLLVIARWISEMKNDNSQSMINPTGLQERKHFLYWTLVQTMDDIYKVHYNS